MSQENDSQTSASVNARAASTESIPQESDTLASALCAVARRAGGEIDRDMLTAALGIAWSAVAVPWEPNLSRWSMYARDAFLVSAARLFGMTIRGIHPPEAARGLPNAPEFVQHFEASYRPLVRRALEHHQPVLAWQGWPGTHSMRWGEIVEASDEGIGLRGSVHLRAEGSTATGETMSLVAPPVQLYVVETITRRTVSASECLEIARSNARRVLQNELTDRFGVVSGPAAYDAWIARLDDSEPSSDRDGALIEHRRLATALIEGYASVVRFLDSMPASETASQSENGDVVDLRGLIGHCRDIAAALTAASECETVRDGIAALRDAQSATARLATL